jgi:hypothetical protein
VLLFCLSLACTRKYADLGVLHKPSLARGTTAPAFPTLIAGAEDRLGACFNQFLFFSNADKEREQYQRNSLQALCPGKEWLMEAGVTSHWWTVLVFTRSCVELEARCAVRR